MMKRKESSSLKITHDIYGQRAMMKNATRATRQEK